MAVCRSSSPQRRRSPSTMATNPTPNPAIMSMERADKNATRSVRMVADRTPSVAASTSRRPCDSRPKARRVGSPSTSCRTRPASEPSRRHCRSDRLFASRPKAIIVTGTASTSATTTTKDSQSCVPTQTNRMSGMTAAAAACGR